MFDQSEIILFELTVILRQTLRNRQSDLVRFPAVIIYYAICLYIVNRLKQGPAEGVAKKTFCDRETLRMWTLADSDR